MRNTTAALADLIPDITIRTRAEVEAEEAAAEAEDDAHSEDEKPVKSSRKAGGFSFKGVSQKGTSSKMRGPLFEELENKLLNGVREGSIDGSQDGRSQSQVNGMYTTPQPGTPMGDLELDPAQVAQNQAFGDNLLPLMFRTHRRLLSGESFSSYSTALSLIPRGGNQEHCSRHRVTSPGRITVLNRPICLHRSSERKRPKIKRIGRFQSVYLVQSVHAPHSREVNAARAP